MEHASSSEVLIRRHSDNSTRKVNSNRYSPCNIRFLVIVILVTGLSVVYYSDYLNIPQELQNVDRDDSRYSGYKTYNDDLIQSIPVHENYIDRNSQKSEFNENGDIIESYTSFREITETPESVSKQNSNDEKDESITTTTGLMLSSTQQLAHTSESSILNKNQTSSSEYHKNYEPMQFNSVSTQTGQGQTEMWTLPTTSRNVNTEETMACHLPKLNAFDPNIKKYWIDPAESYNCTEAHPLLFHTDLDANLIVTPSPSWSNFSDCCYMELLRAKDDDNEYDYSSDCEPILSDITKIPTTMEHIAVSCVNKTSNESTLIDMFNFVHLKPDLEERSERKMTSENSTNMNIVILGLDSLSRLNFIRTMPKTHSFITNKLLAISTEGLTKVGDNTLPVLIPGLAGLSLTEGNETCFGKSKYFDTCPLIWKNFTDAGYRTLFGEDAPNMAIFNYLLKGFRSPPTDYYLRPMMKALKNEMGYHKSLNVHLCYGPRIPFEILLDFMKKTAYKFGNNKKYFQFVWSSTISHDKLNNPKMGDESLFKTLEWLQTEGYLNNTVLILMSDHGMRFGGFRDTYQGSIEARMPYWFTIFPKWFSQKYATAIKIFRRNVHRLTTHYDFHETLLDLLHLENIDDKHIQSRVDNLEVQTIQGNIPRGISLFLPIPLSRNCSTAEIPEHYCVCNEMKPMPLYIYTIDPDILSATKAVVKLINNITSPYPDCAELKIKNVTSALKAVSVSQTIQEKISKQINANDTASYVVNFVTSPGDGTFEASAFGSPTEEKWIVSGEISRTNLYGNQSDCVNDKTLKKYCYCIN